MALAFEDLTRNMGLAEGHVPMLTTAEWRGPRHVA